MKKSLIIILVLTLTGCGISHFHSGNIEIDGQNICIGGTYGDELNYYSITSSEDNYTNVIESSSEKRQYPNMCFLLNSSIKQGYTYRFSYNINNENFTRDVFFDLGYAKDEGLIK